MKNAYPHQGIRIDHIPAQEAGGLIFVAGITAVFLLAVPSFAPLVAFSVLAGAALAPILYRLGH